MELKEIRRRNRPVKIKKYEKEVAALRTAIEDT